MYLEKENGSKEKMVEIDSEIHSHAMGIEEKINRLEIRSEEKKMLGFNMQELPIGYKFLPTDLELVKYYLLPKVLGEPLPAPVIEDVEEDDLYSKPPNKLEMNSSGKKECFFFIHWDGYSNDGIRMVGNGIGFWKSDEQETLICDGDGTKFAFKICWTYYSGTPKEGKRTLWVMSEYRLEMEDKYKEWILGTIKYAWQYKGTF